MANATQIETGGIVYPIKDTTARQSISSLENGAFQYRGALPSGTNLITADVKVGTYACQKTAGSTGYPDDMQDGTYGIVQYLAFGDNKRYFILYSAEPDAEDNAWLYMRDLYTKLARESDIHYKYNGSLSGNDPTVSDIKAGIYASQKGSSSTGYPENMNVGDYCLIEVYLVTQYHRYFTVFDTITGESWLNVNGEYISQQATTADVGKAVTVDGTEDKAPEILTDNYNSVAGTALSFTWSTSKRIEANTGNIDDLQESQEKWCVSDEIAINENQGYTITLTMNYVNGVAAFYDANHTLLKWVNADLGSNHSSLYDFVNYTVIAPQNASYMRIGFFDPDTYPVKLSVLNGYKLKNRRLAGRKWAFIGDSLSAPTTLRASKKYYDYVAEETGITFVNLGVSGTGYANDFHGAGRFITRVPDIPNDTDIVTIFGSGNDMTVLPIGTANDTTDETVLGNVYLTIQAIFTQKPNVLLGIIAPTPWGQYPPYSSNNMQTFVTELETLCRKYSIPFLDLYHESNLRPWEEWFRQHYYSKDDGNGVHPDENGNKRFAPMVQKFIESILLP